MHVNPSPHVRLSRPRLLLIASIRCLDVLRESGSANLTVGYRPASNLRNARHPPHRFTSYRMLRQRRVMDRLPYLEGFRGAFSQHAIDVYGHSQALLPPSLVSTGAPARVRSPATSPSTRSSVSSG